MLGLGAKLIKANVCERERGREGERGREREKEGGREGEREREFIRFDN